MNPEALRLKDEKDMGVPWKKWGPYLSERQWGTVREDYSDNGDAWNYFSHDQARSRAYRWGEDGLGAISDSHQVLCFALAFWNGQDPIIKERLFGLTNSEGNHGEDVKECYFYLDSTPTHSYMKYLYKYPQKRFPYEALINVNRQRSKHEAEYELIDTGVFDESRYFDVFVEYAKASPEDICIQITAHNRGPEAAPLHILPTLWFRNTWSWGELGTKPIIEPCLDTEHPTLHAYHTDTLFQELLGEYYLYCEGSPRLLFTDNDSNYERLYGSPNASRYVKDGINNFVVAGSEDEVNPHDVGTKVSAQYVGMIQPGEAKTIRLRLSRSAPDAMQKPFAGFAATMAERLQDCDAFYESVAPAGIDPERARIFRQGISGMLWSKQYFYYDVYKWLQEHNATPWNSPEGDHVRNHNWCHMYSDDIISMPDKWEYPWFAAWDLAFHMVPLSTVDPAFAKDQLGMMLRSQYLHPNGQMPAYEWNFNDVNPPVHAWATMQAYLFEKHGPDGVADLDFLRFSFSKLLMNFSWWVNRKDPYDKNVFAGGFLGLDNIGIFDRSAPLPTGGYLEQADGTAWMAFYSQQMMRMAIELAFDDPVYEEFAFKFFQHTMWISGSMDRIGNHHHELWDDEDGFFYDVLRLPNGSCQRIKVRSMVGLMPITATVVLPDNVFERLPRLGRRIDEFLKRHPELCANVHLPNERGVLGRRMLSVVNKNKLRRILSRMLDENEFLSPYGIRSLSRYHLDNPYLFSCGGQDFRVQYLPAESDSGMFGGNSNWRGPVWIPVNFLFIRELLEHYSFYGDSFKVEFPTGSGQMTDLFDIAVNLANRLISIFLPDAQGKRPVHGGVDRYSDDPHWKDLILFYEYFHGDNGAGIGASHQTGWTGLIARLIGIVGVMEKDMLLGSHPHTTIMQATQAH